MLALVSIIIIIQHLYVLNLLVLHHLCFGNESKWSTFFIFGWCMKNEQQNP